MVTLEEIAHKWALVLRIVRLNATNKEGSGLPDGCVECLTEALSSRSGILEKSTDSGAGHERSEDRNDATLLPVKAGNLEVQRVCLKEHCKSGRCETEKCTCVRLTDALMLSLRKRRWLINTWPSLGRVYNVKHGNDVIGLTEGHIHSVNGTWSTAMRTMQKGKLTLVVGIEETRTDNDIIYDLSTALVK